MKELIILSSLLYIECALFLFVCFLPGDALPDYNGKLRLFAMRFCPYAHRSVLVLNAKNVPYDLVFVNLDSKPDWLYNFSPRGKHF